MNAFAWEPDSRKPFYEQEFTDRTLLPARRAAKQTLGDVWPSSQIRLTDENPH